MSAGTALYDLVKGLAKLGQQEKNKPATKEDIGLGLSKLKGYQPIQGQPLNEYGQSAYFDM